MDKCFVAVGRAIGGTSVANAIVDGLRREAVRVTAFIEAEVRAPKRQDHKEKLQEVSKAASALHRAITDNQILVFLEAAKGDRMDFNLFAVSDALKEISDRAALASEQIETGAGRGKVKLANRPSIGAKELCALIVVQAWKFCAGALPGENNDSAHAACEAYWLACGGDSKSESLSGWKHWIRAATKLLLLPDSDPRQNEAQHIAMSLRSLSVETMTADRGN